MGPLNAILISKTLGMECTFCLLVAHTFTRDGMSHSTSTSQPHSSIAFWLILISQRRIGG